MLAKVTSLLPVINSEPGGSAAVSVWRDGGKRKCLSHQLFLDWNTEVSKVGLQGRYGNGDWSRQGAAALETGSMAGLEVWAHSEVLLSGSL